MKIVVANSIGIDKNGYYIIHSPSRWSEGVKTKYHWFVYYPWELAYLSSLLKQKTKHRVRFLDGCLMRVDRASYFNRILKEEPDVLIMESATRMIDENLSLALDVKRALGTKLIFVGQHASAFPQEMTEKGVDYVCVGEYEYTVRDVIAGEAREDILGLYPNGRRQLLDVNDLPWPEDSDVRRIDYGMPGEPSSEFREVQMYASRGCPGACNFCVARHVYYNAANWRPRRISNIIDEIIYLRKKYPALEGIFFDEEVHNGSKEFILGLSEAIVAAGLHDLHYEAMCDIRFIDEEVLTAMKEAGYYKIRVGIETASDAVMRRIGKVINLEHIRQRLSLAKGKGIKTYGTFTFGALGSDFSEDKKTIEFMQKLIREGLLDNLQLSICTPQPGTPFYRQAKEKGYLRDGVTAEQFDGGNCAVVSYPGYDCRAIEKAKQEALLARNHCFLKAKMRGDCLWGWIRSIFTRYGVKGFLTKGFKRLCGELKYCVVRWQR